MTDRPERTQRYPVFGFATTHDALEAERELKQAGFAVVPIPAPRSLGSLCGIALRLPSEQASSAEEILTRAGLSPSAKGFVEDAR